MALPVESMAADPFASLPLIRDRFSLSLRQHKQLSTILASRISVKMAFL
jgi:hypothetical protein